MYIDHYRPFRKSKLVISSSGSEDKDIEDVLGHTDKDSLADSLVAVSSAENNGEGVLSGGSCNLGEK
jgi:hypothetical protein